MQTVSDFFGCHVFSEAVMKQKLPKAVFKDVYAAIHEGKRLDLAAANVVANSMKDWAIELGATHFTHWFQPMTGITAEKHDSFISPTADGGVIMEFSGKELIQGEPDASSFPSGGLRATFEARGYTAWDPTSFAFIKDQVLYIPTAFCSYGGEALDKKTPLLRSMQAINKQGLRILKLFGHDEVKAVRTTVGPEQEYFLIDEALYEQAQGPRSYTGRTLFGAKPPKGQELEDHYFGTIKPRVCRIHARSGQGAVGARCASPRRSTTRSRPRSTSSRPSSPPPTFAADHNQLTMELMQKIAPQARHGLPAARRSPSRASTAPASTTTGRIVDRRRRQPARARRDAVRERTVPAVPLRRHPGRRRLSGPAAHLRRLRRQMTTGSARTKRRPAVVGACSSAPS